MVRSGLDVLVSENFSRLRGKRLGFVGNQGSVDRQFRHAVDLLYSTSGISLVRLFAPEHGFRGALQDMEHIGHCIDPLTQLPVISLYGATPESLAPTKEALGDIDVLIFDLQDIGTRYYTFAQTLGLVMQVAKDCGVQVMVLDRPNPLGGVAAEGSGLLKSCRSFCGYAPVPNRHGLTIGELAQIMNNGFGAGENAIPAIACDLEIVGMQGWKRNQYFDQTGLPWVLPSPNMPTLDTAIVYPGMCLFEATNISEGRGTTRPFEFIGAPFIKPQEWIALIKSLAPELTGFVLRENSFVPGFQKFKGEICHGVQVHVLDRADFQSYRLALAMIRALAELYPKQFAWRTQAYEFISNVPAIDLLFGSSLFRTTVEEKVPLGELFAQLESNEKGFLEGRTPFLQY